MTYKDAVRLVIKAEPTSRETVYLFDIRSFVSKETEYKFDILNVVSKETEYKFGIGIAKKETEYKFDLLNYVPKETNYLFDIQGPLKETNYLFDIRNYVSRETDYLFDIRTTYVYKETEYIFNIAAAFIDKEYIFDIRRQPSHVGIDDYTGYGIIDCQFLDQRPPFYHVTGDLSFKVTLETDNLHLIHEIDLPILSALQVASECAIEYFKPSIYELDVKSELRLNALIEQIFQLPSVYSLYFETILEFNDIASIAGYYPLLPPAYAMPVICNIELALPFTPTEVNPLVQSLPVYVNFEMLGNVTFQKFTALIYNIDSDVNFILTGKIQFLAEQPPVYSEYIRIELAALSDISLSVTKPSVYQETIQSDFLIKSDTPHNIVLPKTYTLDAETGLMIWFMEDEPYDYWTCVLTDYGLNPSLYSNYDFDAYIEYKGQYYAANKNGIYVLEGDNDNGKEIHAGLQLQPTDIKTLRKKSLYAIDTGDSKAKEIKVRVSNNGNTEEEVYKTVNGKAYVAKTLEGSEMVIYISGYDMLNQLELEVVGKKK